MDVFTLIWFVTVHGVNSAMYFAVTRVAYGWAKTLLGLLVYLAATAVGVRVARLTGYDPQHFTPLGFLVGFGTWLAVTVALSRRGTRPAAFFEAMLCGAHQLAATGVCHMLMAHIRPVGLAKILASALLLALGAVMIRLLLPRVRRLSPAVDWRPLNVVVSILLVLVYATSVWPLWVADGPFREAIPFVLAVATLVSFFPVIYLLAEKSRAAARLAHVERNVRLMTEEMRTRRAAIDAARRVRHDRRHHCVAVAELLCAKHYDKALAYVKGLEADLQESARAAVWCENETVNAILSGYSRRALAAGVTLKAEAAVPHTLAIPDIDLVAVLANLIENAIRADGEAKAKAKDDTISVQIMCTNGVLRFRISNPVSPDFALVRGWPCETPGVGLQSVRAVVARHGGGIGYVLEGGRLTVQGFLSC